MVAARRHTPAGDLVSELIRAEDDGDRLSRDELKMLVRSILTAGTDTTRNQLAAAVQVFCDHPGQWALLAERPEMAPRAVEEVMRHSPVVFRTVRVAVEDVELGGVIIPAGTTVTASTASAGRDPAVYDDPHHFDISRAWPAPMLTFGGGIPHRLGAHLPKAELAQALLVMARPQPPIRPLAPARWKPVFGGSGPTSLHVEFQPGHVV